MAQLEVLVEGLGHPEGPDVLPDGRVIYVETYASEIGVWDPRTGAFRHARRLRRRAERVHAGLRRRRVPDAERRNRRRLARRAAGGPVHPARQPRGARVLRRHRGRGHPAERAERPLLRSRRLPLLHGSGRLRPRRAAGPGLHPRPAARRPRRGVGRAAARLSRTGSSRSRTAASCGWSRTPARCAAAGLPAPSRT